MIKLMDLLLEVKLSPKEQEQYKQALAILQDETLDEGIKDSLKKLGLSAAVIAALMASPQLSQAQKDVVSNLKGQTTMTASTKTNPNFWIKVNDTNDIKKIQTVIKAYKKYVLALWKNDKAYINNIEKYYSQMTPEEQKVQEKRFMSIQEKTDVDGLNGEFTSKFQFPGAFLKDLNTGNIKSLGLEGNEVLQLFNKSGLTTQQMAEWNQFVKWMVEKKYAGDKKMNNFKFSNDVLQQYKGN